MRNVLIALLALLLFACGDSSSEKTAPPEETTEAQAATQEAAQETPSPALAEKPNKKPSPTLGGLYGVKIEGDIMLYDYKEEGNTTLYGLSDENHTPILPIAYDLIGNPGTLAESWVELKKGNRYGLFNVYTHVLIEPIYDLIFPAQQGEQVAIGQKGSQFFSLTEEGQGEEIVEASEQPRYHEMGDRITLDIHDPSMLLLLDHATLTQTRQEENMNGEGLYITPGYLARLGFAPPIIRGIITDDYAEFGTEEASAKVEENRSLSDRIQTFISSFYESGVDGRGYTVTRYEVSTVDVDNQVIAQEFLVEDTYKGLVCDEATYAFLSDTLIEVREGKSYSADEGYIYEGMIAYRYYRLGEDGSIETLDRPRLWDFTHYVALNPDYFYGCFTNGLTEDEAHDWRNPEANLLRTKHLSIEALDIMRNEIFAEYGYTFKSPKWQRYFSLFEWYEPRFDNVDHLLTELEKQNIQLILEVKARMEDREMEFTQPEAIQYFPAG